MKGILIKTYDLTDVLMAGTFELILFQFLNSEEIYQARKQLLCWGDLDGSVKNSLYDSGAK